MGNRYIFNGHQAPITVHARDRSNKVILTKVFMPERTDPTTGKVVSTGYTALTEEELEQLSQTSRTFQHYKDKLKLLTVHADLPPEAKTPHEALVDARSEARRLNGEIEALQAENETLKARAFDAEEKYRQLAAASAGDEELKLLNDRTAALAAENEKLKAEGQKKSGKRDGKDFS
jgi:predicted  nucleic acid-binding Zn-ribbon protein